MAATANQFPKLLSPFSIKHMTIRNRICSTGHFARWMNTDGLPNAACVAYYEERAKGGIGLLTVGATVVVAGDHPAYFQNTDDRIIGAYQALADASHRHGAQIIAQFCPRGPDIRYKEVGEPFPALPRAASLPPVSDPGVSAEWHVSSYSADELREQIEGAGVAAARARAGGMDGVELHAHEHHLHAQFLSPVCNKRDDAYGGSFENRARFLLESLASMRRAVGEDFVVGVRLWVRDLHPGGWDEGDCVRLVRMLTADRLIDYVSLTGGVRWAHIGPMYLPDGEFLPAVGRVRQQIDVPVIHAGRITTPQLAEQALSLGQVDLVGMVKTHIADPHFPNKVREGRLQDIRYCIRSLECFDIESVKCLYNPWTGREHEWGPIELAPQPRRVVVVGAGPAGMEAALTCAQRGHRVTVLERFDRVGGDVLLAGAAPLRQKYTEVADFYAQQARAGRFEVRLGVEATAQGVMALQPDVAIIATGSEAVRAEVPGAGARGVLTVSEVLRGAADGARNVLIVDREGRAPAFVAADYLASRGIGVTFVATAPQVAPRLGTLDGVVLYQRLTDQGVVFRAGLDLVRLEGAGAILRDLHSGAETREGPYGAVVVAAGGAPVNHLADALRGLVNEIHVVGAASTATSIREATVDGARVARLI